LRARRARDPDDVVIPAAGELFDQLRASNFRDVAGARLVADIPVSDEILNELLAGWIAAAERPVRDLRVRTGPGNRARIEITLRKFSFIPVLVDLFIERQPRLPESPAVILRWAAGSSAWTWLASQALKFAGRLPRGVEIDGDRVSVDLFSVLEDRGFAAVIPFLARVEITTIEARVMVHVALRVSEPPPASDPR
jgi:hypothetical protein